METYTKEFFQAREVWGSQSEKPVFIIGMPRSGTTLAEQKLAAHPDVFGMGEVDSFVYLARDLPDDMTVVQNFAGFDRKTVLAAAKKYLAEIPSEGQSHPRAVNKLPGNYLHLGIIAALFPNAKIIHCRRNIIDSGFSCFQQNFKIGNLRFTTNLDDLALVIQQYVETMEHYSNVLPMEIFELNYEEMVADPEYWTNAMYEYVGVDPAKTAEEKKGKTQMVKTASLWQVRQPVYKTSVEKWRNYETHLADFAKKLGVETGR